LRGFLPPTLRFSAQPPTRSATPRARAAVFREKPPVIIMIQREKQRAAGARGATGVRLGENRRVGGRKPRNRVGGRRVGNLFPVRAFLKQ